MAMSSTLPITKYYRLSFYFEALASNSPPIDTICHICCCSSQASRSTLLGLRIALFSTVKVVSLTTLTKGGSMLIFRRHLQGRCTVASGLLLRWIPNVVFFDLEHVELLRSKDRSWASNTDPANECISWNLEVFHGVEADKGTCATQSCLAVHGNSAVVRVGEVGLTMSINWVS